VLILRVFQLQLQIKDIAFFKVPIMQEVLDAELGLPSTFVGSGSETEISRDGKR
jgi:hypothetical protein